MRGTAVTLLSTAAAVVSVSGAAFGVSGCSSPDQTSSASLTMVTPTVAPPPVDQGPLPAPEALSDVMYRLADPVVPGPAKLPLVEDTVPADAAAFDRFAAALRDTGFAPVTVTATDLRWSPGHAGDVLAAVKIASANASKPGEFSFPMEFHRIGAGWQLTRETADMLMAFGNARTDAGAAPANPPPPAGPTSPTPPP